MDKRPSVFPHGKTSQKSTSGATQTKIEAISETYNNGTEDPTLANAVEQMRLRSMEQMKKVETGNKIVYEELAIEKPKTQNKNQTEVIPEIPVPQKPMIDKSKFEAISEPDFDSSFDQIPIPSKGKTYPMKRNSLKISFMTTRDEDILTSPNILQSGMLLDVLIGRKLLEKQIKYNDLLIGDRNAIMIWLRATSYGKDYTAYFLDEKDIPFQHDIDLSMIKFKYLTLEPDENGLFDFKFPGCGNDVKFSFLTVGDQKWIDEMVQADEESGDPVNHSNEYSMLAQIKSVNGSFNSDDISNFVKRLRVADVNAFRKYILDNEPGVDLNIEVPTPGGGTVKTMFPLNSNFFWPNAGI